MRILLQLVLPMATALLLLVAPTAQGQNQCPCEAPDNGAGTPDLMPTNCQVGYLGFMQISNGLPVGATIDCQAELVGFVNTTEVPGGALGGNIQTWDAFLQLQMTGTGALAGFNRFIGVPVSGTSESGPRNPGDAVQTFQHQITTMFGQLFGDPDFCTFEVRVGSAIPAAPSTGSTTLTRVGPPGNPFQFDSFFDVHYEIFFQGCPGSILDGRQGTTTNTHRFQMCTQPPVAVEEATWSSIKSLYGDLR